MTEQTWSQPITKIEPNKVAVRGYRIDELMGRVPFAHMAYLVLRGELPTEAQGRVMDAILVASVDHGATPPSALAARTVASGGAPLTTGIAAGIMTINRHHGGAIEGCMKVLLEAVARKHEKEQDALTAARELMAEYRAQKKRIPGYGHRIHKNDPRTIKLFAIAEKEGVAGEYIEMGHAIRQAMKESLGKDLPMNVDGAIAAVLCEMDFPPGMGNGLFAIARTVGLTAHVFDEITAQRPMRRISPTAHEYSGPEERELE
ncbi:MAG: citryl-CoA lyase [Anaerolineaceae bacterium 4572_32.1]|nr:MAG: citryl-CoA lyase [Anaerolineaceae bacterium 4572_32.1]